MHAAMVNIDQFALTTGTYTHFAQRLQFTFDQFGGAQRECGEERGHYTSRCIAQRSQFADVWFPFDVGYKFLTGTVRYKWIQGNRISWIQLTSEFWLLTSEQNRVLRHIGHNSRRSSRIQATYNAIFLEGHR